MYDMTEFIESLVSPQTRRSYKFALATFEAWYKKPIKDLLSEPELTRLLEKYWVYLKETYKGNTPRSKFNPVLQYAVNTKVMIFSISHLFSKSSNNRPRQNVILELGYFIGKIGRVEELKAAHYDIQI